YLAMDSLERAEKFLLKSFELKVGLNDKQGLASTSNELATLYLKKKAYLKANYYLDTAIKFIQITKARNLLLKNLELRSTLNERLGNLSKSLDYYKKWSALRDSIFNEEKLKVFEIQSEFEIEQKEQEKQLAENRAVLMKTEIEKNRLIMIGAIVFILFLVIFS